MAGQEFVIEWDVEKQLLSIYKDFPYLVGEYSESSIGIMNEELMFIQNLYLESNKMPELQYDISMGCPYDNEQVFFLIVSLLMKIFSIW